MIHSTMRSFFDHNATTPLIDAELNSFLHSQSETAWGNASSIHSDGRGAKSLLRESRRTLAAAISCLPQEIVFTSGGSESNNSVIKAIFFRELRKKLNGLPHRLRFVCSAVEHPSVLQSMRFIESLGAEVVVIPVNRGGSLDLDCYGRALNDQTALVSIMMANNETGSIFPVQQLALQAQQHGALFHTDAVQALGKIPFRFHELAVDYASLSGHKFYSPKGCGVLLTRTGIGKTLEPLLHGGAQERRRRAGTENITAIAGLGWMAKYLVNVESQGLRLRNLRDRFEEQLKLRLTGIHLTGSEVERLPNTSSLIIDGVSGESLMMSLDIKGYSVSTGAACASGSPEPSPVLLAMGLSHEEAQSSLRVSFGWESSTEEVEGFIEVLAATVSRLRSIHKSESVWSTGEVRSL